jgi:exodeoxyribonuclease V alpha subunit
MNTIIDPHLQFASLFENKVVEPYAYILSKKISEGNICVELDNLNIDNFEDFPFDEIQPKDELIKQTNLVSSDPSIKKPFIIEGNLLYLHRYFVYENIIFNKIKQSINFENSQLTQRIKELNALQPLIKNLFTDSESRQGLLPEEKTDWQLVAAINTLLHQFSIITGGPGTGKTTTVAKILALIYASDPDEKVALAAPTGKAGMRMAESLRNTTINLSEDLKEKFNQLKPYTIHRLLGYQKNTPYFKHNENNHLPITTLIIDESSMIDVALFAKLMTAVSVNTRVILLGDKNQLASVEAGSIFGDLCDTSFIENAVTNERRTFINQFIEETERKINNDFEINNSSHPLLHHITCLKRSRRFNSNEGIGKISKSIINSDIANFSSYFDNKDEKVIYDEKYNEKLFEETVLNYKLFIEEKDITKALKYLNELRVLCAVKESEEGVYFINKRIENILKSHKLIDVKNEFYHNRPIIVTSNNYNLGLFNGDTGIIRQEGNHVVAWFEDAEKGVKKVLPGFITSYETVYAMTIHKSQGSEYNKVLIVLPKHLNNELLTRELLYTGVTRAKNKVIIQSSKEVALHTVNSRVKRVSGISDKFNLI